MARASRSSKKLPAFDPSELSDLIFSPAVGRGVGSHLIETAEPPPALIPSSEFEQDVLTSESEPVLNKSSLTTVANSDLPTTASKFLPTVDMSDPPPVASYDMSTAVMLDPEASFDEKTSIPAPETEKIDMSAVVNSDTTTMGPSALISSDNHLDLSTVDRNSLATCHSEERNTDEGEHPSEEDLKSDASPAEVAVPSSVARQFLDATVDNSDLPTVRIQAPTPLQERKPVKIWVTEQGELVPNGRVKKIGPAQDVLNSAEESVYDTLWATKTVAAPGDETSRTVQAGYHYLGKKTRLSKKTIQRIVDKLIHKGFIEIAQQADIYTRTSTVYRVFSYSAVKERQRRKNRFYVAKMGPGFSYVHEYAPGHLATVGESEQPTVDRTPMPTEDKLTTVTVVPRNLSTVVSQTTTSIGRNVLDKTTSSVIHEALNEYGPADDDAADRLLKRCRQAAADCTEDEIVHFVHQKGVLIRGKGSEIYSPIGFLVTAVPKCFLGESFRLYREEQRKRRDAEAAEELERQRELEEWRREQEQRLADPEVAEEEKRLIRDCFGIRQCN